MKSLLTVTALIEGLTGLALAIMPSLFVTFLLGTSLTDISAIIIARLAGAALITIAISCGLSRSNSQATNMIKAMLVYNILAILLLLYAVLVEHISGPGLWPAVLIHFGLLIWCLSSLRQRIQ